MDKNSPFSHNEIEVLKILRNKKMSIAAITDFYFKSNAGRKQLDDRNYIASVVRRIAKKCEFFDMDWTLEGAGAGRMGRTVWKAKRKHK